MKALWSTDSGWSVGGTALVSHRDAAHTALMKTPSIIGIGLIALGVVLGALHFATNKGSLAGAGGVLFAGVVVFIINRPKP